MGTNEILQTIRDVAARVITPRFRSLAESEIEEKHPGDLVTAADREAELELAAAIQAGHPDAVVLGEEAYAADPTVMDRFVEAAHAFTLDPIDGTHNFVAGSPDHAVMVAELQRGTVVRSWIWQPQHEIACVAELGAGAWCNGRRLAPHRANADPGEWRLVTPFGPWLDRSVDGLAPLRPTWLSCGVDYPHLVDGDADALVYGGHPMPWDHAPGMLLVTETGGHVALADGTPYRPSHGRPRSFETLIAAIDPDVHAAVSAGIREAQPSGTGPDRPASP